MDRYCPECNSTMTPSLVGYLCPDCGHVQRFYTMTGTQLQSTSLPIPKATSGADGAAEEKLPRTDDKPKISPESISSNAYDDDSKDRNKVRGTLRRLMVPELPPAHDHGSPAKKIQTIGAKSEGDNIFENYDDLLDTTVEDAESSAPSQSSTEVQSNTQISPSETVAQLQSSQNQTTNTKKHVPVWVWLVSGLIIFLSTALILLLIIVS